MNFLAAFALVLSAAVVAQAGPQNSKCRSFCTLNYDPVCAVDSRNSGNERSFSNECQMHVYNCEHNKDFKVRNQGMCRGK